MPRKSTKTVAAEDTVSVATVPSPQDTQAPAMTSLVVMAWPGTEETMRALWTRALGPDGGGLALLVRTDDGGTLPQRAAQLLADDEVSEEFIFVPANTFPTRHLAVEELRLPVVYVRRDGTVEFNHRLPRVMTKDKVTEVLSGGVDEPEAFAAAVASGASMPVQVGVSFGNFIAQVLRADPCEHAIIEALLRKKYISANETGWTAVAPIVKKFLSQ
ncbi:MAG: hypothetical protein IJS66_00795 [Bacteroidales bacterium]|nr:hypothetical protein [Bacteroidales bacterium]